MVRLIHFILLFLLVDIAIAAFINGTYVHDHDDDESDVGGGVRNLHQRKKMKKGRSTSSSSGEEMLQSQKSSDRKESLEISDSSSSSSKGKKKNLKKSGKPKSSRERRGWKKWHRKCTPCPDDMHLKWRDPRVKWICGSYQRARRSFKSLCMMHYRNCQDGTMFIKMADHRCQNSTELVDLGQHFFYDYPVLLSDESSDTKSSKTSSEESSSSQKASSSESWDTDKFGDRDMDSENFKNHIYVHNKP